MGRELSSQHDLPLPTMVREQSAQRGTPYTHREATPTHTGRLHPYTHREAYTP